MKFITIRKTFIFSLAFILFCLTVPALTVSAATNPLALEGEFDSLSAKFGSELNSQMERYLANDFSGTHADVVTDMTEEGIYSKITFHLSDAYKYPIGKEGEEAELKISRWLNQALANYPNLCTLYSSFSCTTTSDLNNNHYLNDITIDSPVQAGEITGITNSYKKALAELTALPRQDKTMTPAEKILFIHDQLAALADYSEDSSYAYHTAQSLLMEKKGVCQAYSYVFNHAMLEIGIDSVVLVSREHAWNALRLDGKWYYVDVTWDDPSGVPFSYVRHDYLLTTPSSSEGQHTMTAEYNKTYSSVLWQTGSAYQNFFPKTASSYTELPKNRPFYYLNGVWYFSNRLGIYTWDGESSTETLMSDIPSGETEVCCAVYNGALYYSTPTGIFLYKADGEDTRLAEGNITAMVLRGDTLYYQTADTEGISSLPLFQAPTPSETPHPVEPEKPIVIPKPTATAPASPVPNVTDEPSYTPEPEPQSKAPAKAKIKSVKKLKAGKIRVTLKRISRAKGYQISYATNKKFKKAKKINTKKLTVTISGLKKKKTYYIKARAYNISNGKKQYGKWSAVKNT